MPGIPQALDTDTEDVMWALQTAEALWKRAECADALVWLRRAAQAAGEAEDDDRALALAREGADLAEWMKRQPQAVAAASRRPPASPSAAIEDTPAMADAARDLLRTTMTDEVEELAAIEAPMEPVPTMPQLPTDVPGLDDEAASTLRGGLPSPPRVPAAVGEPPVASTSVRTGYSPPPPLPPRPSHVPSAAEKHAGMLDPWAEGDPLAEARAARAAFQVLEDGPGPAERLEPLDTDEVVTSAPMIPTRLEETDHPSWLHAPSSSRRLTSKPASARPTAGVDLSGVEAFADLPDDARDAFGRAATMQDLAQDEEVAGFALALVVAGSVDLAATIVDTPVERFSTGDVVRARGTIDQVTPLRLVGLPGGAKIATWDERAIAAAFRTCPWVENDLLAAGNRLQAIAGVTMGVLGERLDPDLRAAVLRRLTLRALAQHEVVATRGMPIPGLLVVGAGEIELLNDVGAPDGTVLRPGEFLFPYEALRAATAPLTARAAKGGALVLFAERGVAQELLVTCPPLLEVFAGM